MVQHQPPNTSCSFCGKPLRRSPSVLARNNGTAYCDIGCRNRAWAGKPRRHRGDRGQRRSPWMTLQCAFCGKSVERRASDVRARGRVFCNHSCMGKQSRIDGRSGRPPTTKSGHRSQTLDGYVVIYVGKEHPMANAHGRVGEHRLVMAEKLGRPLLSEESVHHVNGIRNDNRPENLELWLGRGAQPQGTRAKDLLVWARGIVDRYQAVEDRL